MIIIEVIGLSAAMVLITRKSPFALCLSLVMIVIFLGSIGHLGGRLWLMYTLIIIFLGGIIVVFVYTSSINNNFKLRINIYLNVCPFLIIIVLRRWGFVIIRISLNIPQETVWVLIHNYSVGLIIFISLIILSTLFIVVKLVKLEQGPLKV